MLLKGFGRPVAGAMEATGNYHGPIAWRLHEAGFQVRLVSSVALARTREALHNGWDKNDPKDAQLILHMLRMGASQAYHGPLTAGINDVQELSKTHEAIASAKTQVLHRIQTHYLPLYFPEVERFRQNSRSYWFFAFRDRFPTPASITALDKPRLLKPLGASSAGRSRRSACSATSTRRRRPPSVCPSHSKHPPSACSGLSSPRRAA